MEISTPRLLLREIATWATLVGTGMLGSYFFGFLVYHSLKRSRVEGWFLSLIHDQFAAIIGIPLSAASAACLVVIFEVTTGPIEFSALGIQFQGASGPIVFWLLCFLALVASLKMLWRSTGSQRDRAKGNIEDE